MSDPTYVKDEIKANPVWYAAWIWSEIHNDNAPIGWARYIRDFEHIAEYVTIGPVIAKGEQE